MSSGVWQANRISTLVYRSQFMSHADDLRDQAVDQFTQWLRSKDVSTTSSTLLSGAAVEASAMDGTRRVATGTSGTWAETKTGRRLDALRLRLEEKPSDGGAWITTLTVAAPSVTEQIALLPEPTAEPAHLFDDRDIAGWPEHSWVWLDLEHHPAPGSPPIRPGSPRLIRDLLAAVEGIDGTLPLTSDVLDITESHVGELCTWLFDRQRRVPVIVFTPDPEYADHQQRFARALARDIAGVAVVVRLVDTNAAAAFSRQVGTHLHVYGGAMRTYLPGLQPMDPFPRRHRVLSAATMRAIGQRSANAVRDQVLGLSTRRTPPPSYPLVQRALARKVAERSVAERRRTLRPPVQPELFPTRPETLTIPGIDDAVGLSPHAPAKSATREANEILRSVLAFAAIDTTSVPRTTAESGAADVDAERRALEVLFERALRAGSPAADPSGLTAKISALEEENTLLFAETEVLQSQLVEYQQASTEIDQLRFDREFAELELTDAERVAENLRARIRWLETELASTGVHVIGAEAPAGPLPEAPSSVVEVIEAAQKHLDRLVIGSTKDAAAGLDVHAQAELWAIKIWRALVALNAYAGSRASGQWSNSFLAWCHEAPSGKPSVPATWVALKESETTNTMPKLRDARTFPVPQAVESSRRIYMPAHIKPQQGGTPCPRVHFHDDAGGVTGKVFVGYIGDHLPTANFT